MIILFCEVFLFLYFATHRSKTLSPSCQRRQAATAKDTSASSAFVHARFLIINLFFVKPLYFLFPATHRSKNSVLAVKEDKLQRGPIILFNDPARFGGQAFISVLHCKPSFSASICKPAKEMFLQTSCALMLDCRANCTDDSSTTDAVTAHRPHIQDQNEAQDCGP